MADIVACNEPLNRDLLNRFRDQSGRTLSEITDERPHLVVFLRHAGCTFCRQAVADVVSQSESITRSGMGIVLVHMMPEADAEAFFKAFHADGFARISDPSQQLYEAFDLRNGSLLQLIGPSTWWRGAKALFGEGHGIGVPVGNVARLPGSFVVYRGRMLSAFRGETSSDRPDYAELAACSLPTASV